MYLLKQARSQRWQHAYQGKKCCHHIDVILSDTTGHRQKKKKKTEKEKRRRTESRSTSSQIMISGDHLRTNYYLNVLVSWCFELSQPQRITSGLNKKLHSISKLFVSQIVIPQVMFFEPIYIPRALNTGTCINRLWKRAGWPILFRGSTQELELARANAGKTRERFYKKWRWMDRKGGS